MPSSELLRQLNLAQPWEAEVGVSATKPKSRVKMLRVRGRAFRLRAPGLTRAPASQKLLWRKRMCCQLKKMVDRMALTGVLAVLRCTGSPR